MIKAYQHRRFKYLYRTEERAPDLPLWIADLKCIRLNKDGYEVIHGENTDYRIFHGTGMTLYTFNLRANSGATIYHDETIRAADKRDAIKRIKARWPTTQGVKTL